MLSKTATRGRHRPVCCRLFCSSDLSLCTSEESSRLIKMIKLLNNSPQLSSESYAICTASSLWTLPHIVPTWLQEVLLPPSKHGSSAHIRYQMSSINQPEDVDDGNMNCSGSLKADARGCLDEWATDTRTSRSHWDVWDMSELRSFKASASFFPLVHDRVCELSQSPECWGIRQCCRLFSETRLSRNTSEGEASPQSRNFTWLSTSYCLVCVCVCVCARSVSLFVLIFVFTAR